MADFLIAGRKESLERWPDAARAASVFWCRLSNQHNVGSSDCDHSFGCGLFDGRVRLRVLKVAGAQEFDASRYESLLLITPCKNDVGGNVADAQQLVLKLVGELHDSDTLIFRTSSGEARKWIPVEQSGEGNKAMK